LEDFLKEELAGIDPPIEVTLRHKQEKTQLSLSNAYGLLTIDPPSEMFRLGG
jgi:hypothetical protein